MSLYRLQFTTTLVVFQAREQALQGALVAGREKEGELATTSLEFEYLYRKSRCEMLIGGDDISDDVITLGACFHVFSNVCLNSRSFPPRTVWRKSDSSVDGEPHENWRRNSNSRDVVPCPAPPPERPGKIQGKLQTLLGKNDKNYFYNIKNIQGLQRKPHLFSCVKVKAL